MRQAPTLIFSSSVKIRKYLYLSKKISISLNNSFQVNPTDFTASNLTISKSLNQKDVAGSSGDSSTTIVFRNEAYKYLKKNLIDATQGYLKVLPIEIRENCCDKRVIFTGEIKGNSLSWCENDCEIEVQPVEKSQKADLIDFLRNTTIADGDFINNTKHLHVPYVLEYRPVFLAYIIIVLGLIAKVITTVLFPSILAVAIIVAVFSKNGKKTLKSAISLGKEINKFVIRATDKHPTPKITDWFVPDLEANGFNFVSSLFQNSDYKDGYCLFADTKAGIENEIIGLIPGNEPLKTKEELLNDLAQLFNHEWTIQNDTLYFEPKSKELNGQRLTLFRDDFTLNGICFEAKETEQPAQRKVGQMIDGLDTIGNEAKSDYQEIINWNTPPNGVQRGVEEKRSLFGMARFFNDGIAKHPIKVFGGFIASIFGTTLKGLDGRLVMSSGIIAENAPKLLHLNSEGKAINNNALFKKEALRQFHETDDPRQNQDNKPYFFTIETREVLDCNRFRLYENSAGSFFNLENVGTGIAKILSVDINYINRSFTIKGEV